MGNVFSWIGNNFQLLVVLMVFIAPALGKMWTNLQKARAERARRARLEQARIEDLRTGRVGESTAPPIAPTTMQASLEEIAAQRERKLADARQRQSRPSASGVGGAATAPVTLAQRPQPGRAAQPSPRTMRPGAASGGTTRPGTMVIRLPGGIVLEVPDEATASQGQTRPTGSTTGAGGSGVARQQRAPSKRAGKSRPQASPQPTGSPSDSSSRPQAARTQTSIARSDEADAAYAQRSTTGDASARALAETAFNMEASRQATTLGGRSAAVAKSAARARSTPGPAIGLSMLSGATREQLKQAVVLAEVFGRPRGMDK